MMKNVQKMINNLNNIIESLGYNIKIAKFVDSHIFLLREYIFKTDDDRDLIVVTHYGRIIWIVMQQNKNSGYRFDSSGKYSINIEVLYNWSNSDQVFWILPYHLIKSNTDMY